MNKTCKYTVMSFGMLVAGFGNAVAQDVVSRQRGVEAPFENENTRGGLRPDLSGEGVMSVGLWYGQGSGATITLGYEQQQVFGSDENLLLQMEYGQYSRSFSAITTDSDLFEGPFARTIALSTYSVEAPPSQGGDYTYGGTDLTLGFDRDLGNDVSYGFGGTLQRINIGSSATLPVALSDHIAREGNATNTVMAFFNFEVDKSNGGYFPSSGYRLQNGNEFGKSGTVPYLKSVVSFEKFAGFGSGFSLRAHVRAGVGVTSGADQFPLFKNFRGGGLGSVRGFASGTLGPTSAIPGSTEVAHIGGVKSLVGGLEVSRNVAGRDDLFMTGFVDIGNVFGAGETVSASDLRQSVGVGVTWVGPIGPLNVSFAHPLNDSAGDKVELLQFSLGASF